MKTIKASTTKRLEILRGNHYFDDLSADQLKIIAQRTQLKKFERGDALFQEGDPCAGMYIIESGSVKLYRTSPHGRQYIIAVMTEGATCNAVPAFEGGSNPVNVEALETTQAWVVEPNVLHDLVKSDPEFALKILEEFGQNLRNLVA